MLGLTLRWNRGHALHGSHRAEIEVESLATIDQLMQKLLGQTGVNKDLEVLTRLGENILRVSIMALLRGRRAWLLRHVMLLEFELLLRTVGLALRMVLALSRIHGLRSHGGTVGD